MPFRQPLGVATLDANQRLVAAAHARDRAQVTRPRRRDADDHVRGELRLRGRQIHAFADFLDRRPQSSDSAAHPASPFGCPIAIGTVTRPVSTTDGRRRKYSTFSSARTLRRPQARWGDSNSLASSPTPVAVAGLSGATQAAAGGGHTCARLSDSTAACWGDNQYGQLGDGTTTGRNKPVVVMQ
jgi:hypothetical protein